MSNFESFKRASRHLLETAQSRLIRCARKLNAMRRASVRENFFLSWKGLGSLVLGVILVWITYAIIVTRLQPDMADRGLSGDMFGGITALFSGLAFAGLIFTLFVQKKELEYQRKELSRLVDEQSRSNEQFREQAEQLTKQSNFFEKQLFENSFFQLLEAFSCFKQTIVVQVNSRTAVGSDALEVIYFKLRKNLSKTSKSHVDEYKQKVTTHKNDLGPYFRQMYNILKFIKSSNVENSQFYSNILRAQLSSAELSLLFFNCASPYGAEKMAPLVKEYDLLKHFDDLSVQKMPRDLLEFYEEWDIYALNKIKA